MQFRLGCMYGGQNGYRLIDWEEQSQESAAKAESERYVDHALSYHSSHVMICLLLFDTPPYMESYLPSRRSEADQQAAAARAASEQAALAKQRADEDDEFALEPSSSAAGRAAAALQSGYVGMGEHCVDCLSSYAACHV